MEDALKEFNAWAPRLVDLGINLLVALLILVIGWWVSALLGRWVRRIATRSSKIDPTIVPMFYSTVVWTVRIFTLIAVLARFGVQTASLIAVLGAAGLAVGLALQGTLSNVASGIMLLILRPYKVGDVIDVGGIAGSVQRLDLFTTQLSNANNHKIVIPNAKVLGDTVTNITGQQTRRIEINFTVGYGEDLTQTRGVLTGVAGAHAKVLHDPAPWAGVTGLLDSAVQVTLHAWVEVSDWWQTQADLMQAGKEALDAAGIEIPFPHQVAVPYREDVVPLVQLKAVGPVDGDK